MDEEVTVAAAQAGDDAHDPFVMDDEINALDLSHSPEASSSDCLFCPHRPRLFSVLFLVVSECHHVLH